LAGAWGQLGPVADKQLTFFEERGTRLMSKKEVAQINEVLCKVLCHNIYVVIQSMYELGIEPVFWGDQKKVS